MADAHFLEARKATPFVMDRALLLVALDFRIAGRLIISAVIILMRAGIVRLRIGIVIGAIAVGLVRIPARGGGGNGSNREGSDDADGRCARKIIAVLAHMTTLASRSIKRGGCDGAAERERREGAGQSFANQKFASGHLTLLADPPDRRMRQTLEGPR